MQRSESRILTTHAGSLPRPRALVDRFVRASRGEAIDAAAQDRDVRAATERAVAQQLACGVDVGNDGEQSRESFFTLRPMAKIGSISKAINPMFSENR